jgi:outer membrane protein assembly factor BamD
LRGGGILKESMSDPVKSRSALGRRGLEAHGRAFARTLFTAMGVILTAGLLAGCGSMFGDSKPEMIANDPPSTIYGKAEGLVNAGDYEEAARQYEEVDINHPYSQEARKSIVMAAYSYYKAGQYDSAVSAADRYLTLHPGTKEADLAQNIIGMSYYDQVLDPKRDQTFARRSLGAYKILLQRYPNSRYVQEANNRMRILRDLLAANEMQIGRYYLRKNNFLAAINRFRSVVSKYQTTEQVEEALMRLTEAYMALGIVNEAQTAAAVLGHNFPDSKWYKHAYSLLGKRGLEPQEHEGSWITRIWNGDGEA